MTQDSSIIYETDSLQKHMVKCFQWMFMGLLITTGVAYLLIASEMHLDIFYFVYTSGFSMSLVMLIPLFLQLGIVVTLSSRLAKMSVTTAKIMFIVYSMITGITFSFLPAMYGIENMFIAFGFSSMLFGSFVFIGNTMKMDLTQYRSYIVGGLITLVVVSVIGMFLKIAMLDMIICYAGILLFLILTAYDIQKIKRNYAYAQGSGETLEKLSIYGALELYLDFINIFLYVLRILGKKK